MKGHSRRFHRSLFAAALAAAFGLYSANPSSAQSNGSERTFPQSKATIEQVLKTMQGSTSGRLPVLEGFAATGEHPLDRYRRGYYEFKVHVDSTPSGGSSVRVSAEITAWYDDPAGSRSGYQVLASNGRLEADLLDQLADQLSATVQPAAPPARNAEPAPAAAVKTAATASVPTPAPPAAAAPAKTKSATAAEPNLSAPMPRITDTGGGILSSLAQTLAEQQKEKNSATAPDQRSLQAEADSLEQVLKNQAHPNNLVAVKKDGTPVVATASLNAQTLFLASAHDEFEMLDFNQDWVHVRVSGISRGWIWRDSVEMPNGLGDADVAPNPQAAPVAADLYHVAREEQSPFPGDWEPLRGKTVEIVTVEKLDESARDPGPQLRLGFAKSILDKSYSELAQKQQQVEGIVLIFDSADGGMIAAPLPVLQQWKAGKLSDAALWHECFFDPPESFTASAASASQ
jgi:hypothetical protein